MFSNGYSNIQEEIDYIQKILPSNIVYKVINYNKYYIFDYPEIEFKFINKKIPKFKYKKLLKLIEYQTFISGNLYFLDDLRYHLSELNNHISNINKNLDNTIKFSCIMANTVNSNISTTKNNPSFISTQAFNKQYYNNSTSYTICLGLEMNIENHKIISNNNELECLKLMQNYPEDLIKYIIENSSTIDSFNKFQTFTKGANGLIIEALKFNPNLINICGDRIYILLHCIPQLINYLSKENFKNYINKDYYKYFYLLNTNTQLGVDLILNVYNSKYEIPFGILTNKEWSMISLNYA